MNSITTIIYILYSTIKIGCYHQTHACKYEISNKGSN